MRVIDDGGPRVPTVRARGDVEILTSRFLPELREPYQLQLFDRELSPQEQEDIDTAVDLLRPFVATSPGVKAALAVLAGESVVYGCCFEGISMSQNMVVDGSENHVMFISNMISHHSFPFVYYTNVDTLW